MTIIELQNAINSALKMRNEKRLSVLKFLMNEVNKIAKNDKNRAPVDDDIIAAGNRIIKQTKETMSFISPEDVRYQHLSEEIDIINEFLPQKMDKAKLHAIIDDILKDENAPEGKAQRGFVMKMLNSSYKGMFDNAEASEYFA